MKVMKAKERRKRSRLDCRPAVVLKFELDYKLKLGDPNVIRQSAWCFLLR
jgi:hypothetical protein